MDKLKKNPSLMNGKGEQGEWKTINGAKVFIEKGQPVEEAMEQTFKKPIKKDDDKKTAEYRQVIEDIKDERNSREKIGRGYVGKSMSRNAYDAHKRGDELPMSAWRKDKFLEQVADNFDGINIKKMKKPYKNYLTRTSWHHTGIFATPTDFYSIDFDEVFDDIDNGNIELYTEEEFDKMMQEKFENERLKKEALKQMEIDSKLKEEKEKVEMYNDAGKPELKSRITKAGDPAFFIEIDKTTYDKLEKNYGWKLNRFLPQYIGDKYEKETGKTFETKGFLIKKI